MGRLIGLALLLAILFCTLALLLYAPGDAEGEPSASPVRPVAPCATISAHRFNAALKTRVRLGGRHPGQWAHRPVCVRPDYRRVQAQNKRLRRACQNRAGTVAQNLCWIRRAARRWHQNYDNMVRVAWCESTMGQNVGNHHIGLFQFLQSTFNSTPYRGRPAAHPKWNSLAAAWMWAHGRRGEWECR